MMGELLKIGDAARHLGVSVTYLRLLSDLGRVKHQKAGTTRLYTVEDLDKFQAARKARKAKRGKK